MVNKEKESAIRKIGLAWKKWNDSAVMQPERDTIAGIIKKSLAKWNLQIDWKTGKVTDATAGKQSTTGSKQSTAGKQTTGKTESAKKAESTKKSTKQGMSTADLMELIRKTYNDDWTGKNLRRKIRQMDRWNDGKMTHYDFTPQDIIDILTHLGYDAKKAV